MVEGSAWRMSNVTTEQKPPRTTSSPFGKFQVIGLLAAAMLALLIALPYVNGEKGSGADNFVPAPSTGGGGGNPGDPGDPGDPGPDATATPGATATPQSEGTPEPDVTPEPSATPGPTSAAYDDCTASGLTGCEPLREPGSAAAVSYEQCRTEGRPPDECLVAATS